MPTLRVLVIDDEKNMRHMLEVMLGKAGYGVDTAADGVEALKKLETDDFDFVLCDIKMPRMDGMAFLEQAGEKYPEKTFIMMSAYGSIETAVEATRLGAFDYLPKPFTPDEIRNATEKAVQLAA